MLLTHQRFAGSFQNDTSIEGLHRHLNPRKSRRGKSGGETGPASPGGAVMMADPIHEGRGDVTPRPCAKIQAFSIRCWLFDPLPPFQSLATFSISCHLFDQLLEMLTALPSIRTGGQ
ncbi:hypothetical protein AB6802_13550 [Mesorhizobium sp. RCC_202]|uniref:hypothetical protein n=1 Tax=Mesorhizobium sp. RCC_202 TaxID=3239222 RepID=UPI0035248EA6